MYIRKYVYGVSQTERYFLHSFLDLKDAQKYIKKHKSLFPSRFSSYSVYDGDEEILENL